MPELPEVELVVRDIVKRVCGLEITGVSVCWDGYIEDVCSGGLAGTVTGQRFKNAERIGKFIYIRLDTVGMLCHLRMTGRITKLSNGESPPPHTHVVFKLDDGDRLAFSDTRKFGRLELFPLAEWKKRKKSLRLGIDPFDRGFTGKHLLRIFLGRSRCVKSALIDQTLVAGIGNIYANEILHRARVKPHRSAGSLSGREASRLVRTGRAVLREAIVNGGSSISDYRRLDGDGGGMQEKFRVYGREGEKCLYCTSRIKKDVIAGRSTYWCPECQV